MNQAKWNTINLNNVITNNPTLSTKECFQKLIFEIDMLQRGIGPQYAGAFHFCENIIRAICGHPAFVAGFINTPEDTSRLVTNLHSSIINYKAVYKTPYHRTYMLSYNNEVEENEMYFVDCHYRGGQPSFQGQERFYGRPQGRSS